jgi:hypothetical protein
MKKYILVLAATLINLIAFGQNTYTKSEKTSFSVHDTDTEFAIKSSFPTNRSERFQKVLMNALGEETKSTGKESYWVEENFTASFSRNGFKAWLDKKKANANQIKLFKKLAEDLQAVLEQPTPPTPPKQPEN